MQLKSILCPIDFSDFSAPAYQYALSLAGYYKAKIVALHVVELWKYPIFRRWYSAATGHRSGECWKLYPFICSRGEYRFAKPYEDIVRYATEEKADFIIMTTRGADAVDRAVFGSQAIV
jgi:universal stress protein A